MSEAEKQRRLDYKKNRKKWLLIQTVAIVCALLLTLVSSFVYYSFNKSYYINYTEKSEVNYKVILKDDGFFDEQSAEKDKAYIGSLIDDIYANFKYELHMDASDVEFVYSYRIDVITRIMDKASGKIIKEIVKPGIPQKAETVNGSSLVINEGLFVDYNEPNTLAESLTDRYNLSGLESTLILKMYISVAGSCENFEEDPQNEYVTALNIPLDTKIVNISVESSVEEGDNQIIACENETLKNVFMILSIVFAIISVLLIATIIAFAILTRNTDINYEIKVKKIINSYKSFIQQINNPFNEEGYQILMVNTFTEMLEIRDTIQSPVLMNENDDKTCTRFLIPTNTKILYVFEVKVEDYDEIYAEPDVTEEEEVIVLDENVAPSAIEEAIHTPDVSLSSIDFVEEEPEPEDANGVEVIEVVWPEKEKNNKLYRYDPNGETLHEGDVVLVPSRDAAQNKDIIRKAAVAHGNHKVDPEHLKHPLKKIIAIIKRKAENALTPKDNNSSEK